MNIKTNQIYYTVETHFWQKDRNNIFTIEFINKDLAIVEFKNFRETYKSYSAEYKSKSMFRLAKVQNGQSITLACCGYGIIDNFSFADEEPII